MFNSKFNKLLTGLLIVAIVAIIAIIGFFGYSMYNKYYINASAKEAVENFQHSTGNKDKNTVTPPQEDNIGSNITLGDGNYSKPVNNNTSNTGPTEYGGYKVLGTISIPAIKIEYPILEKPTTKALKIAVAYLYGPGVNQVGNTVIQGHNYKNGLFFSNLTKLSNGDKIYIRDTEGKEVTYEVYQSFTAKATDTSFYDRDTAGKREITLSTCTDNDNSARNVVLAREL